MLSLPLISADQVVGAMNVYAHAKDAFDERSEHLGQLFAVRPQRGVGGPGHDRLRAHSQRESTKMTEVAGSIVREAVRRARARHMDDI